MATYLSRLVFPLQIDHAEPWSGSFTYNLKSRQVGAGSPEYLGEQVHHVRRIDVGVELASDLALFELEGFLGQVRGRCTGFWLPLIHQCATYVSGIDAATIRLLGTEFASRWNQSPRLHIHIIDAAETSYYRSITAATIYDGDTLITLDTPLPSIPSEDWSVSLLLYVRQGSDAVTVSVKSPQLMLATFPVVELPLEYEAISAEATVLYLYELGYQIAGNSAWQRYTSFGVTVYGTDNTDWANASIEHGEINEDADGAQVTIKAIAWEGCPLLDLLPWSKGLPLSIRIYETGWDWSTFEESGTRRLLFDGQVKKPNRQGREIAASCASGFDLYMRQLPTPIFSRQCQAAFCDTNCGLSRSLFEIAVTAGVQSVGTGYFIDIACPALAALGGGDWLSLGSIYSVAYRDNIPSRTWESRPILGYTDLGGGNYRFQIRQPFRWLEAGSTCYIMSGCPRTKAACKSRLMVNGSTVNNFRKFFGHPDIPLSNPETAAINPDDVPAGKKGGGSSSK
jgi:hypothetical protein